MLRLMTGLLAGALVAAAAPDAVAFEGTLKLRSMAIERGQFAALTDKKDPRPEDIFAIPPAKAVALKGPGAPSVDESTVYVSGNKLRADAPMAGDKGGYVIVDISKGTTQIVLPEEKRYIEWTQADAVEMGKELVKAQDKLKAQLANLPPEQRQQAEAMLKQIPGMSGTPEPQPKVQPFGEPRKINGFQTSGYKVRVGDEETHGWVTRDEPDLARLYQAAQQNLQKMLPAGSRDPRTEIGQQGLPVLVQTLGPEQLRIEELLAVEKKSVPADLFTVPAGFKKSNALEEMRSGEQR
jgi:hypothetical protein